MLSNRLDLIKNGFQKKHGDFTDIIKSFYIKLSALPYIYFWRGLAFLFTSFILIPYSALFMFAVYMGDNNFFSYDFFSDGVFGMNIFILTASLLMVVVSSLVMYPVFLILHGIRRKKWINHWSLDLFFLVVSFSVSLLIILYPGYLKGSLFPFYVLWFLISFVLYFGAVLDKQCAKLYFFSIITLVLVVFSGSFASARSSVNISSQIVSIGLNVFGVGDRHRVSIYDSSNELVICGQLLLISPKYIYFRQSVDGDVYYYNRDNIEYFKVERITSKQNNYIM